MLLYLPALRELLGTRPLTLVEIGAVGLASPDGAVPVAVQRWTADRVLTSGLEVAAAA